MISVCIPTYNGDKFIWEQLNSILRQLGANDEVVISDDGSTDDTLGVIAAFNDSRIKVYHNSRTTARQKYRFMYTTLNVENSLNYAQGDVIFLADQDDIWLENKVCLLLEQLQSNDLVTSDCTIIDEQGDMINSSYFTLIGAAPGLLKNLKVNSYLGCCMAFRKELLNHILPISKYQVPHDIWIGLLAEIYGTVSFVPVPLVAYRRHGRNVSPSGGISGNSLYFKVAYRFILLFSLLKRTCSRK
jgi:glycosyltransferase involved in cell wall biosynthesis